MPRLRAIQLNKRRSPRYHMNGFRTGAALQSGLEPIPRGNAGVEDSCAPSPSSAEPTDQAPNPHAHPCSRTTPPPSRRCGRKGNHKITWSRPGNNTSENASRQKGQKKIKKRSKNDPKNHPKRIKKRSKKIKKDQKRIKKGSKKVKKVKKGQKTIKKRSKNDQKMIKK